MISLSNVDTEKLLKYATAQLEVLKSNLPLRGNITGSTVAINEIRLLNNLLKKIQRKLDVATPGKTIKHKKPNSNG